MPAYVYGVILVGWGLWALPFFLIRKGETTGTPHIVRRARWGIVIQAIGFAIVWQGNFWLRTPQVWRVFAGVLFLGLADLLSWTSARTLGRQWRFDAGLNEDHQLVQSGAYRVVRHPIYTSMLCLLLGMGFLVTPLPLLGIAFLFVLAGTEFRVRIEDNLLASRFGTAFDDYRRRVAAYIPFLY
jgi:protein-S-isoprenylcysteine O-methyltransferase Ste14